MQAEALGHEVPARRALEEVECGRPGGELLHAVGREDLDGLGDARDLALLALHRAVGDAQHRDHERDVGLHRGDHLAHGRVVLADHPQHAVARLGERRERLERLERDRQPPTVPLSGARYDGLGVVSAALSVQLALLSVLP